MDTTTTNLDKAAREPGLPVTLSAMLLARITLNISYRITYPFLPAIARPRSAYGTRSLMAACIVGS